MPDLFTDTSPDAERKLIEGYRAMSPARKLQQVASLNQTLEELACVRLRTQYGDNLSEREMQLRVAALRLSRTTMIDVFGWDPHEHGF